MATKLASETSDGMPLLFARVEYRDEVLAAMRRIVVLGCAGSGKTLFARRLGIQMGLPVICLDELWKGLGDKKDLATFRTLMADVHADEAWISDGNFAQATFDIRLPRAKLIIWLEQPRIFCAWRVILRVFQRDQMHKLRELLSVLVYIWNFERVNRPRIEAERLAHGADLPVVHLEGDRAITDFVESLRC